MVKVKIRYHIILPNKTVNNSENENPHGIALVHILKKQTNKQKIKDLDIV